MSNWNIFSNFALIGDDLELKQNVNIQISEDGRISHISYDNIDDG